MKKTARFRICPSVSANSSAASPMSRPDAATASPPTKAAMNPLPPRVYGGDPGDQGQREERDPLEGPGHQSPLLRRVHEPGAEEPDDQADDDADADQDEGAHRQGLLGGSAGLRHCEREEEVEEGDGPAVVQPALHVERLPDLHRDPLVRDDRLAESSVGGGEHGADEGGLGEGDVGKDAGRNESAEEYGDRQTDDEEPDRQHPAPPQGLEIDAGGIGEEGEHQRDLRDDQDRLRALTGVDQAEGRRTQQQPGGHEDHLHGDHRPIEATGDQRTAGRWMRRRG